MPSKIRVAFWIGQPGAFGIGNNAGAALSLCLSIVAKGMQEVIDIGLFPGGGLIRKVISYLWRT